MRDFDVEFRQIFQLHVHGGDSAGRIPLSEVTTMLKSIGVRVSEDELVLQAASCGNVDFSGNSFLSLPVSLSLSLSSDVFIIHHFSRASFSIVCTSVHVSFRCMSIHDVRRALFSSPSFIQ